MKQETPILRILLSFFVCVVMFTTNTITTYAEDDVGTATNTGDYAGYYNVYDSLQNAVTNTESCGVITVVKHADDKYIVEALDLKAFMEQHLCEGIKTYSGVASLTGKTYTVADVKQLPSCVYVAGFTVVERKQNFTGVVGAFGTDATAWFADTDDSAVKMLVSTESTESTDMHREMTGQVELNELDASTKNRLTEIRLELEQRKGNIGSSFAYSFVNVFTNVAGVLLIVYAVLLGVAYFIESVGVFDDSIRPYHLLTFKRKWAVGTSFEHISTEIDATTQGGETITQICLHCILLILGGVLLLAIDWFGVAYTIYYTVSGR